MTFTIIVAFTLVAALLVISPGPNGVLIAKTVPTSGRSSGFANVLGFMSAFYLHGLFVIFGLSILIMRSAELFTAVKWVGAAYLCWIGIKALREALGKQQPAHHDVPSRRPRRFAKAYLEGFLTNALNPKVSMFYLAAFPQFLPASAMNASNVLTLVFIHSVLNLVWFGSMVLVLDRVTMFARSGTAHRWLKGITGIVFLGFGAKLASVHN